MPSGRVDQTLYAGTGVSIEQLNTSTLYRPGELGKMLIQTGKQYQMVQLDSGATSASAAGAVLCGHTAFWKSRPSYIVTNDKAQAENVAGDVRNSIAGVFCPTTAGGAAGSAGPTAGYFCVVQQRGTHVGVLTNGTAAAAGDALVAVAVGTSATAAVVRVAAGTAPTCLPVGIATAATSAVTTNYTPARLGGWDLVEAP